MNVAVIGAGKVGTTLGGGLAKAGHRVVYGVRDPSKKDLGGAAVASVRAAVEGAEAVILATPWDGAKDALEAAGDFGGKPLLDATNPIGPGFTLVLAQTDSGGEQVARWAKNARVVKAFNTTGLENMADPKYGSARAAMFVCGDDAGACEVALGLARDLGFDAVRTGGLSGARVLEPVAMLWISLAMGGKNRNIAFGLLRRSER
jgi:8-hydroxy-5-deazaflavin:NADPH oxidoreductase